MNNQTGHKYIRVIPKLDIKGPNLVKGIHLEGLRVLGKPEDFARIYYQEGADELIYIDLVASLYGRSNLVEIVQRIANRIFIPLTVGGGIRTLDDMHDLLRAGADKIAINTALFDDLDLIEKGSLIYGAQCMVVYIEAKKNSHGGYECMHTNARENSGVEVLEWVKTVEAKGAGEILLSFVDTEGTGEGVDTAFVQKVSSSLSIPVIVNGGFGQTHQITEAIANGADAVAAASIFHYHELRRLQGQSSREKEGNTAYIDLTRSGHTHFLKDKIEPADIETVKQKIRNAGHHCRLERPDGSCLEIPEKKQKPSVVVVDYKMGNIFSLCRALDRLGAKVTVSSEPGIIAAAESLILPGVGAFPAAMENLSGMGLVDPLRDHAQTGKPIIGICLGMQLLFSQSHEISVSQGLDILQGDIVRLFEEKKHPGVKLPHIGWNTLEIGMNGTRHADWQDTVFEKISPGSFAYFVHSFALKQPVDDAVFSMTQYGNAWFCSAVQKQHIVGCQFHPELSGTTGLSILKRFLEMNEPEKG